MRHDAFVVPDRRDLDATPKRLEIGVLDADALRCFDDDELVAVARAPVEAQRDEVTGLRDFARELDRPPSRTDVVPAGIDSRLADESQDRFPVARVLRMAAPRQRRVGHAVEAHVGARSSDRNHAVRGRRVPSQDRPVDHDVALTGFKQNEDARYQTADAVGTVGLEDRGVVVAIHPDHRSGPKLDDVVEIELIGAARPKQPGVVVLRRFRQRNQFQRADVLGHGLELELPRVRVREAGTLMRMVGPQGLVDVPGGQEPACRAFDPIVARGVPGDGGVDRVGEILVHPALHDGKSARPVLGQDVGCHSGCRGAQQKHSPVHRSLSLYCAASEEVSCG